TTDPTQTTPATDSTASLAASVPGLVRARPALQPLPAATTFVASGFDRGALPAAAFVPASSLLPASLPPLSSTALSGGGGGPVRDDAEVPALLDWSAPLFAPQAAPGGSQPPAAPAAPATDQPVGPEGPSADDAYFGGSDWLPPPSRLGTGALKG